MINHNNNNKHRAATFTPIPMPRESVEGNKWEYHEVCVIMLAFGQGQGYEYLSPCIMCGLYVHFNSLRFIH